MFEKKVLKVLHTDESNFQMKLSLVRFLSFLRVTWKGGKKTSERYFIDATHVRTREVVFYSLSLFLDIKSYDVVLVSDRFVELCVHV